MLDYLVDKLLEVPDAVVGDLAIIRKLCTFRGAEFEILGIMGEHAVPHFLGENHETAQQLELSEVDFRRWRILASRNELSDVRDEVMNAQSPRRGRGDDGDENDPDIFVEDKW